MLFEGELKLAYARMQGYPDVDREVIVIVPVVKTLAVFWTIKFCCCESHCWLEYENWQK